MDDPRLCAPLKNRRYVFPYAPQPVPSLAAAAAMPALLDANSALLKAAQAATTDVCMQHLDTVEEFIRAAKLLLAAPQMAVPAAPPAERLSIPVDHTRYDTPPPRYCSATVVPGKDSILPGPIQLIS